MGANLGNLMDIVLFLVFVLMAFVAPLIDGQTCLPKGIYPNFLTAMKNWYTVEFGDYMFVEKPHFFVGLVWYELVFLWPLSIANIYAILTRKPWFGTTCLLYGACFMTSLAAILGEMIGSGKASNRLLIVYVLSMCLGILAVLRGLVSHFPKITGSVDKKSAILPKRKLP